MASTAWTVSHATARQAPAAGLSLHLPARTGRHRFPSGQAGGVSWDFLRVDSHGTHPLGPALTRLLRARPACCRATFQPWTHGESCVHGLPDGRLVAFGGGLL